MTGYVVEKNGLFKRQSASGSRWDKFSIAKIYRSRGTAEMGASRSPGARIMMRMETEAETLENHQRRFA